MAIEETLQSGAQRNGSSLILLTGYSSYAESAPPLSLYAADPPWSLITECHRSSIIDFQVNVLYIFIFVIIVIRRCFYVNVFPRDDS